MKPYAERLAQAKIWHAEGLKRVKDTCEPPEQKFPIGALVYVSGQFHR